MAQIAFHPPIHLVTHPDEPIRSTEAAAKFVESCTGRDFDFEAEMIRQQLLNADTPAAAEAAGEAFRNWAESAGLLVEVPEDETAPQSRGENG